MRPMKPSRSGRKVAAESKPRRDDPQQSQQFIRKAREMGADERGSEADDLLGVLAKRKPEPRTKR